MPATPEIALIAERLNNHEQALQRIAESLERLVKLEAHHAESREAIGRAFNEIALARKEAKEAIETFIERLDTIEGKMPLLILSQKIVFGMVGLIVVAVIGALIGLVVIQ